MAAKNTVDVKAAKEAKQKKLLIVLGVVLLGLMAFQLPKLMGGSEPAAAPATTVPVAGDPATVATPSTGAVSPTTGAADLAVAAKGARPKAGESQLASFTLFEAKDPFVQKIVEQTDTGKPASGADSGKGTGTSAGAAAGGITVGGGSTPAVVYEFATLSVNGEPEAVTLKSEFPVDDPMFVIAAVGKSQVKVGIAGGKLTNGKLATIKLGKSLTLVNDATGARYVIQLLYTGSAPEATAAFSAPAEGTPAASAPETTAPASTAPAATP
jgi:hypothetical protein